MRFSDIPGLKQLKSTLISSFQKNHIAHAQLFNGTAGGPALPIAIAYATFLLCENKQEDDACGKCANCQRMNKYIHPDVHFFYPMARKSTDKKDEPADKTANTWREFLINHPHASLEDWIGFVQTENKQNQISKDDARRIIKTVSMKSFEGGMKILIIWYPEMMHPSAANAILKVLEEPPANTVYLMVTYNYENLLTTILSRTQHVLVPVLSNEEIKDFLIREKGIPDQNAMKLAELSGGSIQKALSISNSNQDLSFKEFQEWMQACYRGDYQAMSGISEALGQAGKSHQRTFISYSLSLLRNVVLYKGNEELVFAEGDERKFFANFSKTFEIEQLEDIYKLLNDALYHLERNANPRITFLSLSISILQAIHSKQHAK